MRTARQVAGMVLVTLALVAGTTRVADADLRHGPEVDGAPDGRDANGVLVASGVYFARLAAGSECVATRMLVRR